MATAQPELILHGGAVLTMDARPVAPDPPGSDRTAVAIGGGHVVAVGATSDVLALAGPGTRVVDLRGAAVLPGFQDQHAHPLVEGIRLGWLDLSTTPDLRAGLRLLSNAAAEALTRFDRDDWVEAWYHPPAWRDGRDPSRDELDAIAPDVPVLLHHGSGHQVVANSVALALARIDAGSPDPAGAALEHDAAGEPTGVVRGSDPMAPFAHALPPLTPEALRAALVRVGARLSEAGVTSVADADLGGLGDPLSEVAAYAGAALDRALPQRVTAMPALTRLAGADEDPPTPDDIAALVPPDVRDRLRVGAAKFFADGALTAGDAWLREPYEDAGSRAPDLARGRPALDPDELRERLRRAHRAGWQLATHAIGDAAVELVLDVYGPLLAEAPDRRHRIEHAMLLPDDLLAAMVRLGVVAEVQPEFVAVNGDAYLARLGPSRARDVYAFRRWLDASLRLAFSSDRPFSPGPPLDGIRAALRRAGPSGRRLSDDPGPSVDEALRAWTADAAWAARDEGRTGTIRAGLAADLVVLSADPRGIPTERFRAGTDDVTVLATLVDGEPVFGADLLE